jgi:hypothetical protein
MMCFTLIAIIISRTAGRIERVPLKNTVTMSRRVPAGELQNETVIRDDFLFCSTEKIRGSLG